MAEDEQQLLIRFRGICAHLDLPGGDDEKGKKKRTVLIRHRNGDGGIEHHIPYIEFYADDVASFSSDLKLLRYTRPSVDGTFARVDLEDAAEIRVGDLKPGLVQEEVSYQRDVPHLSEILKGFDKESRKVSETLLKPNVKDIDRSRVAGVFDMPAGRLVAGEPEATITRFPAKLQFEPRRFARWTDLHVAFKPPLVLHLIPLGGNGVERQIKFKKTLRMITIGNEPERLILGMISSVTEAAHGHGSARDATPVQPTGHFILYYDLLENPPESRPVPIPTQLTGSGCPNHNYP
jgi:hypothetical protein